MSYFMQGGLCFMVGLLKQFWILRLNYLVVVPLPLEHKKFCTSIIGRPIGFYITQNKLKMKKMCRCEI
jgi:hypothetical protein